MQTIETKYYGPTNYKGSRIKAMTSSGIKLWTGYDYELTISENHLRAAKLLKEKLLWDKDMVGGDTNTGMIFVFTNEDII